MTLKRLFIINKFLGFKSSLACVNCILSPFIGVKDFANPRSELMQNEENTTVEYEAPVEPSEVEQTHDERQPEAQSQYQKRNDVEYNWAEARRKMLELERITQEQQAMIQKLTQEPEEDDDLDNLSPDDLLTVAQARRLASKEAQMIAEQVVRQRENATMEDRLFAKYPDYTQVVSLEAIEYLKQNEPELASSLHALANDPYAQAVAAYKLLKRINNTGERPMTIEKKKAADNMKKPVSVQAVSKSTSPIGNAHMFENGLTPELKKSLWKEMQEAMKHQ